MNLDKEHYLEFEVYTETPELPLFSQNRDVKRMRCAFFSGVPKYTPQAPPALWRLGREDGCHFWQ